MQIYSEKTNKVYKTVEECLAEEKKLEARQKEFDDRKAALAAERNKRATELEQAYREAIEAQRRYITLQSKFDQDYHSTPVYQSYYDPLIRDLFSTLF